MTGGSEISLNNQTGGSENSSVSDPYHFDSDPDPDPRIRIRDDGSGSGS